MLRVPHEAQERKSLLLLCITPRSPIILEIPSRIFQCRWTYALAIASSDEVDQQAMEKMGHFMLLLTSSTLPETFHQKNGL
jgi:hypothetical protein